MFSRYYGDMSDSGRPMSRDRARGRSSHTSERSDDRDRSRPSSSQHGPSDSYVSRRPGEPGVYSTPYPRPSTSNVFQESYPVFFKTSNLMNSKFFHLFYFYFCRLQLEER